MWEDSHQNQLSNRMQGRKTLRRMGMIDIVRWIVMNGGQPKVREKGTHIILNIIIHQGRNKRLHYSPEEITKIMAHYQIIKQINRRPEWEDEQ